MKPIYLIGDHHGDYEGVFSTLNERGIRDATVIHVGDGGKGFPRLEVGGPVLRLRCLRNCHETARFKGR